MMDMFTGIGTTTRAFGEVRVEIACWVFHATGPSNAKKEGALKRSENKMGFQPKTAFPLLRGRIK